MLGLHSRCETSRFLHRAEPYHDYTTDDLGQDIAAIRDASLAMITVTDTSPVCHLILVSEIDLPRQIFGSVLMPRAFVLNCSTKMLDHSILHLGGFSTMLQTEPMEVPARVECPQCRNSVPPGTSRCQSCGTYIGPLAVRGETPLPGVTSVVI